jgi:hypothetical protein
VSIDLTLVCVLACCEQAAQALGRTSDAPPDAGRGAT